MRPLLSGSGKFGVPWLRMQAEYAVGLDWLEPLRELGAPMSPVRVDRRLT
jgi:hypothetical protein